VLDDDDTVGVAEHEIAGTDRGAAELNRRAELPRPFLGAGADRQPAAEYRESRGFDRVDVAHGAVGDQAREAARARSLGEDLAPRSRLQVPANSGHDDDARAGVRNRDVQHQVVARRAVDRHRRSAHARPAPRRPNGRIDHPPATGRLVQRRRIEVGEALEAIVDPGNTWFHDWDRFGDLIPLPVSWPTDSGPFP
jgi:hypothetical protein